MMYWGSDFSWWAAILMSVGMLAFLGVIIWAVSAIVSGSPRRDGSEPAPDARRILDGRLARGDIDTDEYHRLRDALADHKSGVSVGTSGSR